MKQKELIWRIPKFTFSGMDVCCSVRELLMNLQALHFLKENDSIIVDGVMWFCKRNGQWNQSYNTDQFFSVNLLNDLFFNEVMFVFRDLEEGPMFARVASHCAFLSGEVDRITVGLYSENKLHVKKNQEIRIFPGDKLNVFFKNLPYKRVKR